MRRVLVIEDDLDTLEIVGFLLCNRFHVCPVSTESEAFDHLANESWDAIVLDLSIPGMDITKFGAIAAQKRIPIVLMTGESDATFWLNKTGARFFLRKPFQPDDLLLLVSNTCETEQDEQKISGHAPLIVLLITLSLLNITLSSIPKPRRDVKVITRYKRVRRRNDYDNSQLRTVEIC